MTGLKLKKIRKNLGLTQSQFAKELSVDRVTISRWERGKRDISYKYKARIKMINGTTQQAEAQFVILLDKFGPLTMRDFLTCVESATPEEIKKMSRMDLGEILKT